MSKIKMTIEIDGKKTVVEGKLNKKGLDHFTTWTKYATDAVVKRSKKTVIKQQK